MARAVHIPVSSLESRVRFLARADAVRRLQLISHHRAAGLLRAGVLNEIQRLRSDMRRADPYVSASMAQEVQALVEHLKRLPEYQHHGHVGVTAIPKAKRR